MKSNFICTICIIQCNVCILWTKCSAHSDILCEHKCLHMGNQASIEAYGKRWFTLLVCARAALPEAHPLTNTQHITTPCLPVSMWWCNTVWYLCCVLIQQVLPYDSVSTCIKLCRYLQRRAHTRAPEMFVSASEKSFLEAVQVPAAATLFFSLCENVVFSFEGVKVHICSQRETCCYCSKTNRINLTSRGSGAETSLTTAAGPGDYCTLPNQAVFWTHCHFYPSKKEEGERRVSSGIRNNGEDKRRVRYLLWNLFWVAALQVLCKQM